jgi:hypothetical protein
LLLLLLVIFGDFSVVTTDDMIKTVVIVGRDKNKGCAFFFFPFRFFHIASIIFSRNSSQQIFLWPIIEKKFNHGENTTKKVSPSEFHSRTSKMKVRANNANKFAAKE